MDNANNIDTLLLDLGGVIMDIDRNRCVAAFEALGMTDIDAMLDPFTQKGLFKLLEEGDVSAQEFRREIRSHIPTPVTDSQIDRAFEQFLLGIPSHRLKALRQLRPNYRIFMLSNTNPIMWNGFIANAFRAEDREREDYFDGMLPSFEARCMKPDPRIFKMAIERFGLNPATTLFCDDGQANCSAAAALGFQTRLVNPSQHEFYEGLNLAPLAE